MPTACQGGGTVTPALASLTHVAPAPAPADRLARRFYDLYDLAPEGIWRAPGRANLIGDYTDFNGGLALPFAIERSTFVAARRRPDARLRLWSEVSGEVLEAGTDQLRPATASDWPNWARYGLGVIWAALQAGVDVPGLDIAITTELPLGSGLSSSAALTVALTLAVEDLSGAGMDAMTRARLAQAAESDFGGMPCGLLDQLAVLEGRVGGGVLIDFLTLHVQQVPLTQGPLVIVNTNVPRENASGNYARRRAECEQAARSIGVDWLSQATPEQVESLPDTVPKRRARHVLSENARTAAAARALAGGEDIGELLTLSHRSLRDDFEASCPELDLVVETSLQQGAAGARLTGAGFGGCAIVLGITAADLRGPVVKAFAATGRRQPELWEVTPSPGAGRVA